MNRKNDGRLSSDKRMLKYGLTELYSNIFCFSTTRHGGYSEGAYATFNCNAYCGDACDAVRKNRGLLCSLLPEGAGLLIPHQVHGTEVRVIDEAFLRKPESERARLLEGVDALVSDVPKACLCISTADCIPVLCYDVRRRAIAAIHAGWRGTVSHIVSKTLEKMRQAYGTEGKDVCACIGPGISQEAFEVGDEVCEAFRRAGFDMERIAVRKEKWHIDLWEANRMQLMAFGIEPSRIEVSGICTYTDNEDFFSARRQGTASGRILSGIMMC